MKLIRFDQSAGQRLAEYGSKGAVLSNIMKAAGSIFAVAIHLEPGGQIGNHPAAAHQLFLVISGKGWVMGGDNVRSEIGAGQGAYWVPGESHAAGAETPMSAIVIEGDSLDLAHKLK